MLTLTTAQHRELAARAHKLNPVVIIGKLGLTDNVLNELDSSLCNHELIKVKVILNDHAARELLLTELCQKLGCASIKHIGKIFVIYRPNPEEIKKTRTSKPIRTIRKKLRQTKRSFQA